MGTNTIRLPRKANTFSNPQVKKLSSDAKIVLASKLVLVILAGTIRQRCRGLREVIRHFRRLTALSGTIFLPPPRVFAGMTLFCVINSCRKTPSRLAKPALRLGRIGARILGDPPVLCKCHAGLEKGRRGNGYRASVVIWRRRLNGRGLFPAQQQAAGAATTGEDSPSAKAGRIM